MKTRYMYKRQVKKRGNFSRSLNGRALAFLSWITKYALTKGIIKAEAEEVGLSMDVVRVTSGEYAGTILSKNSWYSSREGAIAKAEGLRKKKIHSLQMQLDKLNRMQF